jgi:hypothetical protein
MIAFKKDIFNLIEKQCLDLYRAADKLPTNMQEKFRKSAKGILALFEHKETKKPLLVVNTQLTGNEGEEHVRQNQAMYLMESAAALIRKHNLQNFIKSKGPQFKPTEKEKKRV